jgi:galactose mutarotase-like enzyme
MVWTAEFKIGADPREKCPVNLTNHTYWNLSGDFKDQKVDKHGLILNAS